ncbi:hypothetical protein QYF36_003328 [Acer negundo]|nr:hypothetical protein QYF36_003328 [Acer negundo]
MVNFIPKPPTHPSRIHLKSHPTQGSRLTIAIASHHRCHHDFDSNKIVANSLLFPMQRYTANLGIIVIG